MIGVYKITNPKGRVYIGSSKNIKSRFADYKNKSCKKQRRLYNSFLKYGYINHKFEVLIECKEDELYEYEHLYALHFNALDKHKGLNCEIPRFKQVKGEFSQETKDKIAIAARNISDETRLKMSLAAKNRVCNVRKMVFNKETCIFYDSITDAAKTTIFSRKYVNKMLLNHSPNRTSLIYV